MKKLFLSFVLVAAMAFSASAAQQLPNADFENWTGNPLRPVGWQTIEVTIPEEINPLPVPLPPQRIGTNEISRTTDSHTGSFSMRVAASPMNPIFELLIALIAPELSGLPAPGFATNGTVDAMGLLEDIVSGDFDVELIMALGNHITDGLMVTERPYYVSGFVRPTIVTPGDATLIAALVFSGTGDSRQVIGAGMMPFPTTAAEFQSFAMPIEYIFPGEPSELVIFVVAIGQNDVADNTSILINNLVVGYTPISNSVNSPNTAGAHISFNGNTATIDVEMLQHKQNFSFELYNLSGKMVMNKTNLFGNQSLNVSHLSAGVYIARIVKSNGNVTQRIVIR